MPVDSGDFGGGAPGGGGSGGGIVTVPVTTDTGAVVQAPRTIQDAITETAKAVTIIRGTAPTPDNLPANAKPGQMFTFTANPNYIYVLGTDNVWRALALVDVV